MFRAGLPEPSLSMKTPALPLKFIRRRFAGGCALSILLCLPRYLKLTVWNWRTKLT
jgi:hypothetical protein